MTAGQNPVNEDWMRFRPMNTVNQMNRGETKAGLATNSTTATEAALDALGLATLDMATSLLAGVADKTGEISLDYLVNENVISGIVDAGDYYDYSDFEYARSYPTEYTYWVLIDGALPVTATLDINAYLADASVNGELPEATDYAALFAAAADDALEVIELVHTQIYTEILPGTIEDSCMVGRPSQAPDAT